MHNSQYVSCDWLQNGIDFELNSIEICCFRCHSGGGRLLLSPVENGTINYDLLFDFRNYLIQENKQGKINSKCKDCFNLKKSNWSEKPVIKYIHFNHWTYCNSDCEYCYIKKEESLRKGMQNYNALPILKEILSRVEFDPDGEITFAGGEPTLLNEFDEIIEYLLEIGAKKIIVHSSGVKYSSALERGIREQKIQIVISPDSGTEGTFKKIKNTCNFATVWENTKKYAQFQTADENVISKYIFVPSVNDNQKEILSFIRKVSDSNVKTIVIDIEHEYYFSNKNNPAKMLKLLSLCEFLKAKASASGIKVLLYNTATYLYDRYKLFVPFYKYKSYFADILILAIPILIGELGHNLIGTTDVLVVARYSIDSLAAISIANSIIFTLCIFGLGIVLAVSIILPNLRGTGQKIKKYLPSTLVFSVILAATFTLICFLTKYLVPYFGFDSNLIPYIQEYIAIVSFSMFGMFVFEGVKQFLQSYEIVNFPNFLLIMAVLLNVVLDILFVFGYGIVPSMGSKGAAIATLSVRSIMGLIMFIYIFRFIDFKLKLDFSYMKQLVKIGTPIGVALLLEFLAFNVITILVGRESGLLAAIHNILITIASATFMVPLAVGVALSVKVAYYYGAKKCKEIRNFSVAGAILGVGFMVVTALTLAIFPRQIIGIFTNELEVLNIALPIVSVVAMYQIFDGFQVIMGSVLKGFKMTKFVSNAVLIGYWFVGAPVATLLVWKYGLSLRGYWIALAVSLCTMGFVQAAMAKHKFRKIKEICN